MVQPNIIFIVLDTLRADRVLSFHENILLTPFIKNLLKNSFYFTNCISNSPWTLPSHISMFTGLYSTQNALISKNMEKISTKTPILTEILKDMGYFTACFSENAFISKTYGLTRGFDVIINAWDWNPWIREHYNLFQLMLIQHKLDLFIKKSIKSKLFLRIWAHINDRSEKIIKSVIKMFFFKNIILKFKNDTIKDLERFTSIISNNTNNKPFYLFFNFLTTHDPYIPIQETFKPFGININDFKKIKEMLINPLKTRLDVNIKSKRLSKKQIKIINKLYDSCVYSSDLVIKKVFLILKKLNLLDNSYIIITSDHGEHLGDKLDHYFWEHNTYQSVYESLMRVPLIIFNTNFKKRFVNDQVQLKDLFHTILHMTGIPTSQNKYLDIKNSILHQIDNNSTPKYIFGEYTNPKEEMMELINTHRRTINWSLIPKIFHNLYFIRSNEHKYIQFNKINLKEYYDLLDDPNEQINKFNKNNENCKKMKLLLKKNLNKINNLEELSYILTEKEKDSVKKIISNIKIKGI